MCVLGLPGLRIGMIRQEVHAEGILSGDQMELHICNKHSKEFSKILFNCEVVILFAEEFSELGFPHVYPTSCLRPFI